MGKVYCFGPTFRAEKSKTRRHLTEFWMLEAEVAFADNDENMRIQEEMLQYVIAHVIKNCPLQFKTLGRKIADLEKCLNPFKRITYDDTVDYLHSKGSKLVRGKDMGAEMKFSSRRTMMCLSLLRIILGTLKLSMKNHPENKDRVLCSDLLAPGMAS